MKTTEAHDRKNVKAELEGYLLANCRAKVTVLSIQGLSGILKGKRDVVNGDCRNEPT